MISRNIFSKKDANRFVSIFEDGVINDIEVDKNTGVLYWQRQPVLTKQVVKFEIGLVWSAIASVLATIAAVGTAASGFVSWNKEFCYFEFGTCNKSDVPKSDVLIRIASFTVYFDSGSASAKRDSLSSLSNALQLLNENSEFGADIRGYTDNVGSAAVNAKLSDQRAAYFRQNPVSSCVHGVSRPYNPMISNNSLFLKEFLECT